MRSYVPARVALVTALALAGTACDSCHNDTPTTTVRGVGGGSATGGDAAAAGDGATANVPLRVPITSPLTGGFTIVGEYRAAPRAAGTVVLVHQLSSNRAEWAPLVARLRAGPSPLSTFAIDLRGHGESTRRTEDGTPSTVTWQSFGNDAAQWAGVADDVRAALEWVRSRPESARIVVVGSSIGSSAALLAASGDPTVSAVVMISPGTSYRGIDTLEPMRGFASSGRAALLIAGQGDTESAAAVGELVALAAGNPRVQREVYDGTSAHGVSIAAPGARPSMWERIEAFVRDAVNPLNAPSPPPQPTPAQQGEPQPGSGEGANGGQAQ